MRNESMDDWNRDKYWGDGGAFLGYDTADVRATIVRTGYAGEIALQRAQEENRDLDVTAEFAETWIDDEANSYRGGVEAMRADIPFLARWFWL
jgi:hypothetical protein